jgi:hypothetical protein
VLSSHREYIRLWSAPVRGWKSSISGLSESFKKQQQLQTLRYLVLSSLPFTAATVEDPKTFVHANADVLWLQVQASAISFIREHHVSHVEKIIFVVTDSAAELAKM